MLFGICMIVKECTATNEFKTRAAVLVAFLLIELTGGSVQQ